MTKRLVMGAVFVALFALVIVAVPFAVTLVRAERSRLQSNIERDASVIATLVVEDLANRTGRDLQPVAVDYSHRLGGRVVVTDNSGVSVADSDNGPTLIPTDFSSRPEVATSLHGDRVTGNRYSATLQGGLSYVAVPVASAGKVHGVVRITYSTSDVDQAIRRRLIALGVSAAVGLLAAGMVAWAVARSINRPLAGLRDTTVAFAAGKTDARADEEQGPRELRDVARSFNEMVERVDELLESQRGFVADASHQLRTPLTSLRLRLEQLRGSTGDPTAIDAAMEETSRLQRVVEGLLTLTRAGGLRSSRERLELSAVIEERRAMWEPLAGEGAVDLVVDCPPVFVFMPPGTIEQILDNLLDNAIDHAPRGSAVEIAVLPGPTWTDLHVRDHGPGLDAEGRQRAFDRFWRGQHPTTGGTGLGLAIVEQLVTSAGGSVRLDETQGGGLDVVLTLSSGPEL